MAIQLRRGNYADFDPQKMKPAEVAVVQGDDPSSADGKAVYVAISAGDVKRMAVLDELQDAVYNQIDTAISTATQEAVTTATQAAAESAAAAEDAADRAEAAAEQAEGAIEVDDTLSVEGRAADAKKTGDEISLLKSDLNAISSKTKNVFDPSYLVSVAGWGAENGVYSGIAAKLHQNFYANENRYPLTGFEENTRYTLSFMAKTDANEGTSGAGIMPKFVYSDGTNSAFNCQNSTTDWTNFKGTSSANKTLVAIGLTYGGYGNNVWYLKNIQLEKGTEQTDYVLQITAKDDVARGWIDTLEDEIDEINGKIAWQEVVDIPWENGNIYMTAEQVYYNPSSADKRIRTPNGYVLRLSKGDRITIPSNNTVQMYVGWKANGGGISYVGWINTSYTAEFDSEYYLLAEFNPERVLESVSELSQHIVVTRYANIRNEIEVLDERITSLEDGIDPGMEVPEYFELNLTAAISLAQTSIVNAGINGESFVFLSDIHWENNEKHSPALVNAITDTLPIENTFFGGDAFNGGAQANIIAMMNDIRQKFSVASPHFLSVYGNHDGNQLDGGTAFEHNEFYTLLQKQSDYYVDYEATYYFYMDNEATRTRFIVLDSRTGTPSTASEQIAWLQNVTVNVPNGWHFIVFVHVIFYPDTGGSYDDPSTWIMSPFMTNVCPVLDAINAVGDKTVEAIFAGHCHIDYNTETDGGIPIVMIDCDTKQTVSGNPQVSGTIGEQCLDIVTVNYSTKTINCARVGRGSSRMINY